jgi:dTDP-4-dehydrorhamnose 3,5-epimerase-like enzyme
VTRETLPTVGDLAAVTFAQFADPRGVLIPLDLSQSIPFQATRMFWIYDVPAGITRGSHGHKICHQFLICAAGSLQIEATDGLNECVIPLTPGQALHVPPGILTTQRFGAAGSVLMVLCSRSYEPADYIHDLDALVAYRREMSGV